MIRVRIECESWWPSWCAIAQFIGKGKARPHSHNTMLSYVGFKDKLQIDISKSKLSQNAKLSLHYPKRHYYWQIFSTVHQQRPTLHLMDITSLASVHIYDITTNLKFAQWFFTHLVCRCPLVLPPDLQKLTSKTWNGFCVANHLVAIPNVTPIMCIIPSKLTQSSPSFFSSFFLCLYLL